MSELPTIFQLPVNIYYVTRYVKATKIIQNTVEALSKKKKKF